MAFPQFNITVLRNQIVAAPLVTFSNTAYIGLGRFVNTITDPTDAMGVRQLALTDSSPINLVRTLIINNDAELNETLAAGSPAYKDLSALFSTGGARRVHCLIFNDQAHTGTTPNFNQFNHTWATLTGDVNTQNSIRSFLQSIGDEVDLLGINFYQKGSSLSSTAVSTPDATPSDLFFRGGLDSGVLGTLNTIATERRDDQKPLHILLGGYLVSRRDYDTAKSAAANSNLIAGVGYKSLNFPHISLFTASGMRAILNMFLLDLYLQVW